MSTPLYKTKLRAQLELERHYPATIEIGGVKYKGAIATQTGPYMTSEGSTKQRRTGTFQFLSGTLPLAIVRDITDPTQPLRRLTLTHIETGHIYRLAEEHTDPHGCTRTLTGHQSQD